MSHLTLLVILLLAAVFGVIALGVGTVVLRLIERAVPFTGDPIDDKRLRPSVTRLGASLLTGYAVLVYAGVVLGLAHVFYEATVIAALVVCAVIGRKEI